MKPRVKIENVECIILTIFCSYRARIHDRIAPPINNIRLEGDNVTIIW